MLNNNLLFTLLFCSFGGLMFAQIGDFDPLFASANPNNTDGFYITQDEFSNVVAGDAIVYNDSSFITLSINQGLNTCVQLTNFTFDGNPVESFDDDPSDEHFGTKMHCFPNLENDAVVNLSKLFKKSDGGLFAVVSLDKDLALMYFDQEGNFVEDFGDNGILVFYSVSAEEIIRRIQDVVYVNDQLFISFTTLDRENFSGHSIWNGDILGMPNPNFGDNGILDFGYENLTDKYAGGLEYDDENETIILSETVLKFDAMFNVVDNSTFLHGIDLMGNKKSDFGTNGSIECLSPSDNNEVVEIIDIVSHDNEIYMIGYYWYLDKDNLVTYIAKTENKANLDMNYGDQGRLILNSNVGTPYIQPFNIYELDGHIYSSGLDFSPDNLWGFYIARLDEKSAQLDPSFGNQGFTRTKFKNDQYGKDIVDYQSQIVGMMVAPGTKHAIFFGNVWYANGNYAFGKIQISNEIIASTSEKPNPHPQDIFGIHYQENLVNPVLQFVRSQEEVVKDLDISLIDHAGNIILKDHVSEFHKNDQYTFQSNNFTAGQYVLYLEYTTLYSSQGKAEVLKMILK